MTTYLYVVEVYDMVHNWQTVASLSFEVGEETTAIDRTYVELTSRELLFGWRGENTFTLGTRSLGVIKVYEEPEADTATQASVGGARSRAQHIATVAKKIGEGLEGRVRERAPNALVDADAPIWSSLIDSIAEVIVDEQFAFTDRLVESLMQAKARTP